MNVILDKEKESLITASASGADISAFLSNRTNLVDDELYSKEVFRKEYEDRIESATSSWFYDNYSSLEENSMDLFIEVGSPLSSLHDLKFDWDGRGAYPLSNGTIKQAELFYDLMIPLMNKTKVYPEIAPGAGDFVEFLWRKPNGESRIEVWVYGEDETFSEYCIAQGEEILDEGTIESAKELAEFTSNYLA